MGRGCGSGGRTRDKAWRERFSEVGVGRNNRPRTYAILLANGVRNLNWKIMIIHNHLLFYRIYFNLPKLQNDTNERQSTAIGLGLKHADIC